MTDSEALIRGGVFAGVLILMALLEMFIPRRRLRLSRIERWPANLGIVAFNALLMRLLIPMGAMGVAAWTEMHDAGLLHALPLPDGAKVFLAVVLLDLAIYAQHVLFHAVPVLWRLHMVHHADRDIDVSTGLRFHPIEILLSMAIKMAVILALGASPLAVLIFEVLLNGMAMFNHGNVRLPLRLDGTLRLLLVTPDMHRVHHSVIRRETNSNYGFNLSCWDRLFHTYRAQPEHGHEGMTIGLEHMQQAPTGRIGWMLALPFRGRIGQYPILKSTTGDDR